LASGDEVTPVPPRPWRRSGRRAGEVYAWSWFVAVAAAAQAAGALRSPAAAQEPRVVVDSAFIPRVAEPVFGPGEGPRVLLDEAHHNLYSNEGYYRPLRAMLEEDGYRVASLTERLTSTDLSSADLVVIANALPVPDQVASDTLGPAFTPAEVHTLLAWIRGGGNLLLLIDHRPYAHAAAPLLHALGLTFTDGYALDYQTWDPLVFRRSNGTLGAHPITEGRDPSERVDSVATFDGDAFRATGRDVVPLLRFGDAIDSFQPERLWAIGDSTPHIHVAGWLQGAAFALRRGRIVVFGESGMAVAQLVGPDRRPRGMNTPVGGQNARFLLNAVHWLTRVLP
jgi:hypothetical protein